VKLRIFFLSFPDPGFQKKKTTCEEINDEENTPQRLLLSEQDGTVWQNTT
jgi:hypothetical protein